MKPLINKKWFSKRQRGGEKKRIEKDDPTKTGWPGQNEKNNRWGGYNRGKTTKYKLLNEREKEKSRKDEKKEGEKDKENEKGSEEVCKIQENKEQTQPGKETQAKKEEITEINIFVPHTAYSRLCSRLQKVDDQYSRESNLPRVKFTERGGSTVGFECLRSNPWARD